MIHWIFVEVRHCNSLGDSDEENQFVEEMIECKQYPRDYSLVNKCRNQIEYRHFLLEV